jgi:hypothetical protein
MAIIWSCSPVRPAATMNGSVPAVGSLQASVTAPPSSRRRRSVGRSLVIVGSGVGAAVFGGG